MRRPELTPALDTSPHADHDRPAHPRLIGGSRLSQLLQRLLVPAMADEQFVRTLLRPGRLLLRSAWLLKH
jgi:hypothetical protein